MTLELEELAHLPIRVRMGPAHETVTNHADIERL